MFYTQEIGHTIYDNFNKLSFEEQLGILTLIIAIFATIFSSINVLVRVALTHRLNKKLEKKKYAEKKYEKIGLLISKVFQLEATYKKDRNTEELESQINSLFMELAIYLPKATYEKLYDGLIDLENLRKNIPDLINHLREDFSKDKLDENKVKLLKVVR